MSEVQFDEARVAMDSLETKKLGVDVDSAYIQGARWQFEQDKAVIEGKDKEIERIKAIATEIISNDPAYHCYRDLQKASGVLSVLLGEEDAK